MGFYFCGHCGGSDGCIDENDCLTIPPTTLYASVPGSIPAVACPGNPNLAGNYVLTFVPGSLPGYPPLLWQYGYVKIGDCACGVGSAGTYVLASFGLSCAGGVCVSSFSIGGAMAYAGGWLGSGFSSYSGTTARNQTSWTLPYTSSVGGNPCLVAPLRYLYHGPAGLPPYPDVTVSSTPP